MSARRVKVKTNFFEFDFKRVKFTESFSPSYQHRVTFIHGLAESGRWFVGLLRSQCNVLNYYPLPLLKSPAEIMPSSYPRPAAVSSVESQRVTQTSSGPAAGIWRPTERHNVNWWAAWQAAHSRAAPYTPAVTCTNEPRRDVPPIHRPASVSAGGPSCYCSRRRVGRANTAAGHRSCNSPQAAPWSHMSRIIANQCLNRSRK